MFETVSLKSLAATLGLDSEGGHHLISLVGGGGKTTLLHALGNQLSGRTILTTTTKMGYDQSNHLRTLIKPDANAIRTIQRHETVMIWEKIMGQKAIGVKKQACDQWFSDVDHIVVEADGSRRKPFKAPADYEPVIPSKTTLMISVIGADALGRVIADQCHRPLRVAALAGCEPYQRLTPLSAAKVLLSQRGSLKELPHDSQMVIVITKINQENSNLASELHEAAKTIDPQRHIVGVSFEEEPKAER
ncbi:MAG: putative selenium-dependent hydroxylase accessory protein YqeC [Acidimicrobiaceae bacterium]|jgi:molybdenum cofactor cytidylyltransferase|nr:putative selenium-dependent hydroxylase accessory protein YqeC [Acidimicrobiaceae bacterium]|tara:strand:- start:72174 stop:72914 length:741 start_codon:yes stop_codon:yes gene_type:complete